MRINNYFHYQKVFNEINGIIGECEAILINKPKIKQIWKIYQRILNYEHLSQEIKDNVLDVSIEIPGALETCNIGDSQSILNINDSQELLKSVSKSHERIIILLKQCNQLLIREISTTMNENDIKNLDKQIEGLLDEITRISQITKWNGNNLIDGTYEEDIDSLVFQIGKNKLDQESINLKNVSAEALDLINPNISVDKINKAITDVLEEKHNVLTKISVLENYENTITQKINNKLVIMISILKKTREFCRSKGEFYFSNSSKNDIPHWLN